MRAANFDDEMLDHPVEAFLALKDSVLTPEMTARQAAQQFEDQASDALAVVTDSRSECQHRHRAEEEGN